eukprot:6189051-Pleurochrysis_carterae.AAC.2
MYALLPEFVEASSSLHGDLRGAPRAANSFMNVNVFALKTALIERSATMRSAWIASHLHGRHVEDFACAAAGEVTLSKC